MFKGQVISALLRCGQTLNPLLASSTVSYEDEEEKLDDYYNYDDEAREEPMSRQDWFDLRTRRKRQAPEEPKKENTLVYTVCVRYAASVCTCTKLYPNRTIPSFIPSLTLTSFTECISFFA